MRSWIASAWCGAARCRRSWKCGTSPTAKSCITRRTTDSRSVRCVEFEAKGTDSLEEALATLERFERATGFAEASRSRLSLPQILFPDLAETLVRRAG